MRRQQPAGNRTKVCVVVPGFNDAHVHFVQWSLAQREIRLGMPEARFRQAFPEPQRVSDEHNLFGETFGARGHNVLLTKYLQHR